MAKFSFDYIDYKHSLTRDQYHALDKISRVVFPLAFLVFNVVYISMVVYYVQDENQKFTSFLKIDHYHH